MTEETKAADGAPAGVSDLTQLLAFDVEIGTTHCIVFAATASKARWLAVKGYREAGYGSIGAWPSPHAKRAEIYDNSPLKLKAQKCWVPEYVAGMRG